MSASNRPNFTPGPWAVSDAPSDGTYDVLSEPGNRGDGWHEVATGCSRLDARLISASPEMYEALRDLLRVYEDEHLTDDEGLAIAARAALAKAEGRA